MTSPDRHAPRGGFTLAELIIALLLLGTVTAALMPMLFAISAQRRASELRQRALIHAENLLDESLSRSGAEQTQEQLTRWLAQAEADEELPGLERTVAVRNDPDLPARQITLELRWRNRHGEFSPPLRLSGWSFSPAAETP